MLKAASCSLGLGEHLDLHQPRHQPLRQPLLHLWTSEAPCRLYFKAEARHPAQLVMATVSTSTVTPTAATAMQNSIPTTSSIRAQVGLCQPARAGLGSCLSGCWLWLLVCFFSLARQRKLQPPGCCLGRSRCSWRPRRRHHSIPARRRCHNHSAGRQQCGTDASTGAASSCTRCTSACASTSIGTSTSGGWLGTWRHVCWCASVWTHSSACTSACTSASTGTSCRACVWRHVCWCTSVWARTSTSTSTNSCPTGAGWCW